MHDDVDRTVTLAKNAATSSGLRMSHRSKAIRWGNVGASCMIRLWNRNW